MFNDFYSGFYYSSLIIAAIASILLYNRLSKNFKWIAILILLTSASELIAKYVAFTLHKPNSVVYHFFTPVEYTVYVIIYLQFLGDSKWTKLLWLSVAGLVLVEVLNTIFLQPLVMTNTNTMIVESLLLVLLSLFLFLRLRERSYPASILTEGVFWFNCAVLCYYSFNILVWGFHSLKVYLMDNPPKIIYNFNFILSGLLYLTYTFAMVLNTLKHTGTKRS